MHGCLHHSAGIVHYFIYSGDSDGTFVINSSSGVVTLTSSLDHETSPLHRLIIRASDSDPTGGARYTDFDLQVHVEDVNDNNPLFSNNLTTIQVRETLSTGEAKRTAKTFFFIRIREKYITFFQIAAVCVQNINIVSI